MDSFASVSEINVGPFRIRHLDTEEIDALFAGRCQLDQRELPESVREKLADSWFVVVDNPARPLADYISFGGAVGHHDWEGTFRNINLGLNLFKAAAGPVVLAHTYNWNSSLFHRQQHECPEPHGDLYPSSWGGSEEPPLMRLYQLAADDVRHLPEFWQEFDGSYFQIRRSLPDYLHRAIGRFLDACGLRRADYESRQAHYIMALEALFSGEEEDCVRPLFAKWNQQSQKYEPVLKWNNRTGRQEPAQIYASDSITKCCAALIAPEGKQVSPLQDWLYQIYKQRSRVTHGSTFEQEEFYALPQNPDEHGEAKNLCEILGVDLSGVWEGPDMGFAVLHNAVRLSILSFIGHAASCLQTDKFQKINHELAAATGKDKSARATREHLRGQLQDSFLDEKRKFLQRLYDGLRNETDRQEIRSEVVGLVRQTR